MAVTLLNQIVSWRSDWSLPHQANNRFRGHEVEISAIGVLTDHSLVKMIYKMIALILLSTTVKTA